jgi:hypothetical protein
VSEIAGDTEADEVAGVVAEATALAAERYEVQRELARTAVTRTVAARDAVMGRDVALVESLGPDGDEAVRREARTLARLAHPAIAPLYDAGERGGRPFLATKIVAGRRLDEVIADAQTFAVRASLLPVASAIAEALAHAHAAGVGHRVEPAGVLVGVHGETVVVDWSRTGETVDARADVRAAGALLYFLLSGTAPRDGGPPLRSIAPEVPEDLVAIVETAMARGASAADLAQDLARFQAGRLAAGRSPSPLARARGWIGAHRALAASIAAVAVAGLVVLAILPGPRARAIAACRDRAGEAVGAVWNPEARTAVTRRYEAASARLQGAGALGALAIDELDTHAAGIRDGLAAACIARLDEPTAGAPELLRACHERALHDLAAVTAVFAAPSDGGLRFAAPDALGLALDAPARCAPELLARLPPEPGPSARRQALDELRARMSIARAGAALREPQAAELRDLIALAERSGYGPALAEVKWVEAATRPITATSELHAAARLADSVRDDFRRARILTSLVDETRPRSGIEELELLPRAAAAVARLGEPSVQRALDRAIRRRAERVGANAPAAPTTTYREGEEIEVEWRGGWYPGKVIRALGPGIYRISYDGYDSSWDESVTPDRMSPRSPRSRRDPAREPLQRYELRGSAGSGGAR